MREVARSVLLGTAVGDALGLVWEGMGPDGITADARGWPTFLGRGIISDDTEHAYLTYRAWCAANARTWRGRGDSPGG